MGATLGTRLSRRDRGSFIGRAKELALLDDLFVDDPPASVVLVHGPGGIGKSTLLRELARRGSEQGFTPVFIEGRDLGPQADALEDSLGDARGAAKPLVLIDTYERMAALGAYLRRDVLPSLPEKAIIVIAGRRAPEAAWFQGGWESLSMEVELSGLSDEDSFELLRSLGMEGDERAQEVVAWTAGSPLALTLSAAAAGADPGWSPEQGLDSPETVRMLIRRLADTELEGTHTGALGVAAIARVTTIDLLREVLPRTESREAYDWLRTRTFAEPIGEGVTLHELVRKALYADLRRRHPDWERELRRRIADYFYARATQGDLLLSIELAHLVENQVIRWGYSWEGSVHHRIDDLRSGDADEVERLLIDRGVGVWWQLTRPFFEQSPERVAIARDSDDVLCGYQVAVTPNNAPDFADADPLLGPWLRHARSLSPEGNAVLWHDSVDFTGNPHQRVQAMLGMAGILRSGLDNPRWAYLPISSDMSAARAFAEALGCTHLPELDLKGPDGEGLECHLLDYGPGGLLGTQRDWVYAELGLQPPAAGEAPRAAAADLAQAVRDALRDLRVPHKLATNPLATGTDPEERAASVRSALEDAVEHAFGETENESLLERILVRGYLDPAASHEQAADELNVSRSTYFRRLRLATDRVADYMVAARGG